MKKLAAFIVSILAAIGLFAMPASAHVTSGYANAGPCTNTYWNQDEVHGAYANGWSYGNSSSCLGQVIIYYYDSGGTFRSKASSWTAGWNEASCSTCTLVFSDHNFKAWCGGGWCSTAWGYRRYH